MPTTGTDYTPESTFADRHMGPRDRDVAAMLATLGLDSLGQLVEATVPRGIRTSTPLGLGEALGEHELLTCLREIAALNEPARSFLGLGYSDCLTPPVIQRNILENPAWYTQYTPYQSEIAQGRLEALLNFQTAVIDLTGLPVANASLLDESTAAAEAMNMMWAVQKGRDKARRFLVADDCHPQTIEVVRTRAAARDLEVVVAAARDFRYDAPVIGILLQYPSTEGEVADLSGLCSAAHEAGALAAVAADILSLAFLVPPGEFGADVAVGNAQRLGMPMGFGGPHAAYFATREEFRRQLPGRIIGVSRDAAGKPALRMALQTREQHIRREKATSNICTAQVLPAVVASMYCVYHGPAGLAAMARRVHGLAQVLATGAQERGFRLRHQAFFDTVVLEAGAVEVEAALVRARNRHVNLRRLDAGALAIALDEATAPADVALLLDLLSPAGPDPDLDELATRADKALALPRALARTSRFLQHPVFNRYQSETEMLRYMRRLESRDLSLTTSMIPLGSCTMKLNATAEMMPITWPEFARPHPFAPMSQNRGYECIFAELSQALADITGLPGVSLQPNAGSQGEYTGLLVIRRYHEARSQGQRRVCLIPASAHGTNPASAVMAGLEVVVVACDDSGNVDLGDLRTKAGEYAERLAALMVTYPSTHGVFEEAIRDVCATVHEHGGQVYLDGANMNAMVGLCRPGEIGVDVCHLNLHKTFAIPHGGGGPGMGPIAAAPHLAPYLPGHPLVAAGGAEAIGPVAESPFGSAVILLISWAYLKLMGGDGLRRATEVAILNANYVAHRLADQYPVLYRGSGGFVAHEAILDLRHLKAAAGIEVDDVAKRLMDYGYHAPTVHFPVAGTVMVEPTESESREELDRFCEAMIAIRGEIAEIEAGTADGEDNLLKNAPHTVDMVLADQWEHAYSRERAALPAPWVRERKFWPAVGRVENALGDRNLVCTCPPVPEHGRD